MNKFHCYGLSVISDFEFDCLPSARTASVHADVIIEKGVIGNGIHEGQGSSGFSHVAAQHSRLIIPEVGKFSIIDGQRIIIDPDPNASLMAIEAYLFGTVFGILIHQRNDFPFHASVLKGRYGAVSFTAPSGFGKSSLVAFLARSSLVTLISDDMGRITFDTAAEVHFHAGPRKLKLWEDAATWLQLPHQGRQRDSARENKFHYMVSGGAWRSQSKLNAIVYLKRAKDAKVNLRKVTGEQAIRVVLAGIYRPAIGAEVQSEKALFLKASRIASSLNVYILSRPWGFEHMDRVRQSLYSFELI